MAEYPTGATYRRKALLWLAVQMHTSNAQSLHGGGKHGSRSVEAAGHTVSKVRKQREMNSGAQLTYSFFI